MITYTKSKWGDTCMICGFNQATWIVTEETEDNYNEIEVCSECKESELAYHYL